MIIITPMGAKKVCPKDPPAFNTPKELYLKIKPFRHQIYAFFSGNSHFYLQLTATHSYSQTSNTRTTC